MASPQLEGGYIRIANEIVDALIRQKLSGRDLRLILFIIRKTYGYNKKKDAISYNQIAEALSIKRQHACSILNRLVLLKMVTPVTKNGNTLTNTLEFNKDYEKWGVLPNSVTVTKNGNRKGKRVLPNSVTTKDNNILYNKDISILFEEIWGRYLRKIGKKAAERHFRASVKTKKDWKDINKALDNYLKSERVLKGIIQDGSTWFNNWRDWIDYKERVPGERSQESEREYQERILKAKERDNRIFDIKE